jgi:anti-sigma-K factor RskA
MSDNAPKPFASRLPSWWNTPAPWRRATAVLAAATAIMLLVVARPPSSAHYVGVLSAPGQQSPGFIVIASHSEIVARAVGAMPPHGRVFELWAVYPNVSRPQALGVISAKGVLRVKDFPTEILAGASFAVSVEAPAGAPVSQPTGPVVFVGKLRTL